jgi:RimJ/RimL family protein N-acetyltransferase
MDLSTVSFVTDRLMVRACSTADAQELSTLMDPQISQWVAAWPNPLSVEMAEWIISSHLDRAIKGQTFAAVILAAATGRIVGWLKLDRADEVERVFELGYWIGIEHQRKGYALEVSKGAINFAFTKLGAAQVIAGAQVGNDASLRLLAKLGMSRSHSEDVWAPARQRFEHCEFWYVNAA